MIKQPLAFVSRMLLDTTQFFHVSCFSFYYFLVRKSNKKNFIQFFFFLSTKNIHSIPPNGTVKGASMYNNSFASFQYHPNPSLAMSTYALSNFSFSQSQSEILTSESPSATWVVIKIASLMDVFLLFWMMKKL